MRKQAVNKILFTIVAKRRNLTHRWYSCDSLLSFVTNQKVVILLLTLSSFVPRVRVNRLAFILWQHEKMCYVLYSSLRCMCDAPPSWVCRCADVPMGEYNIKSTIRDYTFICMYVIHYVNLTNGRMPSRTASLRATTTCTRSGPIMIISISRCRLLRLYGMVYYRNVCNVREDFFFADR